MPIVALIAVLAAAPASVSPLGGHTAETTFSAAANERPIFATAK